MAVISADTISTLQKLIRNAEFSSRAIKVAALLSLNHPEAEKILLSVLENGGAIAHFDAPSLALSVNALCILVLERADAQLFGQLLRAIAGHPQAPTLLPLFCTNLGFVPRLGFHSRLAEALHLSLTQVHESRTLNDLKWQLCSLSAREPVCRGWRALLDKFASADDEFFEAMVIQLSGQFPLPGFPISQWNSLLPAQLTDPTAQGQNSPAKPNAIYANIGEALLSFERNDAHLWTRTVIGRHCYTSEHLSGSEQEASPVNEWLASLGEAPEATFQSSASARRKSEGPTMVDPFQDLPQPSARSFEMPSYTGDLSRDDPPLDIPVREMLQFIVSSSRTLEHPPNGVKSECRAQIQQKLARRNGRERWRQFVADFGLLGAAREVPASFHRDLRHLDMTLCREVHKVAVIYVARDQDDKQSILANATGSGNFNAFVEGLGWPIQIGSPQFFGYNGGLPSNQMAPYFASTNTELIFHVSTWLNGDTHQRMKHLGNDEVHVVWSENTKPYRRDLLATRFCDVLIVLYTVSPVLVRVHIETQDPRLQFGPLFDGACVHMRQVASLVRETVLNASRAYRNLRVECDRPNKHRERVFQQTRTHLGHLPLAPAIVRLFAPNMDE